MSYTAIRCATEEFEQRVDRYDNAIGEDPAVLEARMRISDMLEHFRQLLVKLHAPKEELQKLKDLEDMVTELESEDVLAIARADMDGAAIAVKLGLMYGSDDPHDQYGGRA